MSKVEDLVSFGPLIEALITDGLKGDAKQVKFWAEVLERELRIGGHEKDADRIVRLLENTPGKPVTLDDGLEVEEPEEFMYEGRVYTVPPEHMRKRTIRLNGGMKEEWTDAITGKEFVRYLK